MKSKLHLEPFMYLKRQMNFNPIHLHLLQIPIHHLQVINIMPHAILLKLSSLFEIFSLEFLLLSWKHPHITYQN
jgi:hypothetical protein